MNFIPTPRQSFAQRSLLLVCFAFSVTAQADVFGRVTVTVKDADTQRVIDSAEIILHDLSRSRPDIVLKAIKGVAMSPLLENRVFEITAKAPEYVSHSEDVQIKSDTTHPLEILLATERTTITVTGAGSKLHPEETSSSVVRGKAFNDRFPVSAQMPQQLTGVLLSTPGFVQDSANQVHPRGEHSATSVYIQGFQLGGALQGRFGPTIDPESLENIDIMTGGYSPEYAGGAAVLNTTIRSGSAKPFHEIELGGGNYDTSLSRFQLGGQAGADVGAPDNEGYQSKILSYFVSGSARTTNDALESPQPRNQSAHNHGESENILARFDVNPDYSDTFSLIVNGSPAKTDVANRSGLPNRFAPYGQGYGFGGALSAQDAADQVLPSQDQAKQDIYQTDRNNFGVVQWRHEFDEKLSSLFSLGMDRSELDTKNDSPSIDLKNLAEDSSIEYNPDVERDSKHQQVSGSLTYTSHTHSLKFGAQYSGESAEDSYQLIPGSQLAVDALHTADLRLLGSGVAVVDTNGDPVFDQQGNQLFKLTSTESPKLAVSSRGYYSAMYGQDTWQLLDDVTANYGVRYDTYRQLQNLGEGPVDKDQFSPRMNLSWTVAPSWLARASYNRLFIEPPLSQGSVIGSSIIPERVNQYETSLEKEFTTRQRAKVSYYYKDIDNQVDTGLLIPSTQLGLFTSVNLDRAAVHGVEFSYDLLPDHGTGVSAYTAYAYSVAKPSGFDNTGEPVDKYNDHDQRHTLSTGVSYAFENRNSLGATYYYGSGLASSVLADGMDREDRNRVDFNATSAPDLLFGVAGLKLTVGNLFDERDVVNFDSAFSGTRFEQGRTVFLSTYMSF